MEIKAIETAYKWKLLLARLQNLGALQKLAGGERISSNLGRG